MLKGSDSVVKIGVAAWLSGPGELGWSQENSVKLAVDQVNASGGLDIGGTTFSVALVSVDGDCNQTNGANSAATLVASGVVAVVGHSCSSSALGAQPVYFAANVPLLLVSASRTDLTLMGYDTTFRIAPHDASTASILAEYLYNWLGVSSAAIVEPTWWLAPGDSFEDTFSALGGNITSTRQVNDASDFSTSLAAIQPENPEAIVNFYTEADSGVSGGQLSDAAYDLGMTDVIIAWNSETNDVAVLSEYATAAGAAAEGDVAIMKFVSLQDMPGWGNFLADYQAAGFANEPNDPYLYGPFAYDAAMIIMQAIDRADSTNPADIRDEIALMQDHDGVVGKYLGFDANGDVLPQWSWIVRFRQGQWLRQFPGQVFLPVLFQPATP